LGKIELIPGRINAENITKTSERLSITVSFEGASSQVVANKLIIRHGPKVFDHFLTVAGEEVYKACSEISGVITKLGISERLDVKTDMFF
jgi:hypothetical protein